jgi:hypothetical protein
VLNVSSGNSQNVYAGAPISGYGTNVKTLSGVYDRNDSTFERRTIDADVGYGVGGLWNLWSAYDFDLPLDKLSIEYDKYYLGILFKSHVNFPHGLDWIFDDCKFVVKYRRFLGSVIDINSNFGYDNTKLFSKFMDNATDPGDIYGVIDDLPDFYYLVRTLPDNNKSFYFQIATAASHFPLLSGLNLFPIDGFATIDNLKSIQKMSILFTMNGDYHSSGGTHHLEELDFYELALICEKSISIQESIFAMFSGREFNNTWGSRKTATALIDNPIDMLEHSRRLQNWSEVGDNKVYGKEYCANAKIKVDANEGSYHEDNTLLDSIRALRPSFQVTDEDNAWTDTFAKMLCEQYFLCTRQDSSGYECVHYLDPQATDASTPAVTVTFADVVGDIGQTEEPKSQNVFCEPFINYAYNPGNDKFDKQLRILNAADAAWVGTGTEGTPQYAAGYAVAHGAPAEYTPGFSGTDGQAIWTACHALWLRFRTLEQPPSNLTDSRPVVLYADALNKITDWVAWMGKRRTSFTVPYNFTSGSIQARDWHVAMKLNFNNPHKTNGWNIKCLIEKIEKDKHAGTVKVDIILLEDIPTAFFLA